MPTDEGLIVVHRVWSLEEARTIKKLLEDARVPAYFGPGNIDNLDALQDEYEHGIDVKVWDEDNLHALQVLNSGLPLEPKEEEDKEKDYVPVCPKCHSDQIVFRSLDSRGATSPFDSKFHWRCDACGYRWTDDGVEREESLPEEK